MSHRNLVTRLGTAIPHWHKDQTWGELTAAQKAQIQAQAFATYPGIDAVEYVHLNHTPEDLGPTNKYNCWGFTFNPRQCWVGLAGSDIQAILDDNGTQVYPPDLRVGDVVCYRDSVTITHTGRIWSLDAAGNPALVQSKWGSWGEYLHPVLTVPAIYGTSISYWRVVPIGGKGDAWAKDFAGDDRNVSPPGVALWMSPDLWCNNTGATGHVEPVRHQPNQLWVRVRNEDTLPITNGQVHLYWTDPTGGMAHYQWHPIGTATVNVPAGPGTDAIAGPVTWTPGATEPQHCCLFAVLDTGDDPFAAQTLDPIVWPFDVRRDNNIVWKNMFIAALPVPGPSPGPKPMFYPLDFFAENPTQVLAPIEVTIKLRTIGAAEMEQIGFDRAAVKRAQVLEPALPEFERMPAPAKRVPRGDGLEVEVVPEGDLWLHGRQKPLPRRGLTLITREVLPGRRARVRVWVGAQNKARPGQFFRLDFEQRIGGSVTGGCTYVVALREDEGAVH